MVVSLKNAVNHKKALEAAEESLERLFEARSRTIWMALGADEGRSRYTVERRSETRARVTEVYRELDARMFNRIARQLGMTRQEFERIAEEVL